MDCNPKKVFATSPCAKLGTIVVATQCVILLACSESADIAGSHDGEEIPIDVTNLDGEQNAPDGLDTTWVEAEVAVDSPEGSSESSDESDATTDRDIVLADVGDSATSDGVELPAPTPPYTECLPPDETGVLCSTSTHVYRPGAKRVPLRIRRPSDTVVEFVSLHKSGAEPAFWKLPADEKCLCERPMVPYGPTGVYWHKFDSTANAIVDRELCAFPPGSTLYATNEAEGWANFLDYSLPDAFHLGVKQLHFRGYEVAPFRAFTWEDGGWTYANPIGEENTVTIDGRPFATRFLWRWVGKFPSDDNFQEIPFPFDACGFPAEELEPSGCLEGALFEEWFDNRDSVYKIWFGDHLQLDASNPDAYKPNTFFGVMPKAGLTVIRFGGWSIGGDGYLAIDVKGTTPGVYENGPEWSYDPNVLVSTYRLHDQCNPLCMSPGITPSSWETPAKVVIESLGDRLVGYAEFRLSFFSGLPLSTDIRVEFDLGYKTCE